MNIYDLMTIPVYPPDQRAKNVFFSADEFKTRVIELKPGRSPVDGHSNQG